MTRGALSVVGLVALISLPWQAVGQDAKACVNEVERLSSSFSIESGNDDAIAQRPSARQGAFPRA
jgi:hypothetical protein